MTLRRTILKTALAAPVMSVLNASSSSAGSNENKSFDKAIAMNEDRKIIDHFMWAAIDLKSASSEFERLTGVRPSFGGRHPGFGTHNALVSMSNGSYMEVLALDPEQDAKNPIVNEIAQLTSPEILAFHIARSDLESVANVLEGMNIAYTGPLELGRERPDGATLRWRLLFPESPVFKHALPIFIDWMDAPHPSTSAPAGCELTRFEVGHPNNVELTLLYEKLDVSLPVVHSEQAFAKATLQTPKGMVVLHGQL
jgi:hypothetical protein